MHINGNLLSNARANDSESTGRGRAGRDARRRLAGPPAAAADGSLSC